MIRHWIGLSLLVTAVARAQTPGIDFEKVLLPVEMEGPYAGAHGSLWTTQTWILNAHSRAARVEGYFDCEVLPCPARPPPVPPGVAFRPRFPAGRDGAPRRIPGGFVFVEREAALGERVVALRTIAELEPAPPGGFHPADAELSDFASIAPAEESRIRIEIAPLTAAKIWAFCSVTNNETQHVTVITPN